MDQHQNYVGIFLHEARSSSSPSRWWSGAGWTSRWVWERPIVFRPERRLVTPPTGCARRPGCSSRRRPTRWARQHESRWRRARLRNTRGEWNKHIVRFWSAFSPESQSEHRAQLFWTTSGTNCRSDRLSSVKLRLKTFLHGDFYSLLFSLLNIFYHLFKLIFLFCELVFMFYFLVSSCLFICISMSFYVSELFYTNQLALKMWDFTAAQLEHYTECFHVFRRSLQEETVKGSFCFQYNHTHVLLVWNLHSETFFFITHQQILSRKLATTPWFISQIYKTSVNG